MQIQYEFEYRPDFVTLEKQINNLIEEIKEITESVTDKVTLR